MNKEKAGFVGQDGIFPLVQNALHVQQKVHIFPVLLTSIIKDLNSPKNMFLFCKPIQQMYMICALLKIAFYFQ